MIRKILCMAFMSLLPILVSGQDKALMDKVEALCSRNKTVSAAFTQTMTVPGKPAETYSGKYEYREGYLSMVYDKPAGRVFLIDGNTVKTTERGETKVFDCARNVMMKNLSHVLLDSFSGRIAHLCDEQGAVCAIEETSSAFNVTLKATKKAVRGYEKIDLIYNKRTNRLESMVALEFGGVVNVYKIK